MKRAAVSAPSVITAVHKQRRLEKAIRTFRVTYLELNPRRTLGGGPEQLEGKSCLEMGKTRKNKCEVCDKELSFGHVMFMMPIRHPNRCSLGILIMNTVVVFF